MQSQKFRALQFLAMDGSQLKLSVLLLFAFILLGNIGSSGGAGLNCDDPNLRDGPFEGCQAPDERSSSVDELDWGRVAYCIGVNGHSAGTHHFGASGERLNKTGIAMYHTSGVLTFWNNFRIGLIDKEQGKNLLSKEFTDIKVTSIMVNGRPLEGWYHLRFIFPKTSRVQQRPGDPITPAVEVAVYAFVIQIEDETTYRATGEFTTELLSKCNGIDKNSIPTLAQIVPCHSIAESQAALSNAVVYWREAESQYIKTSDLQELRVNWKLPANFGGGFANRFFIRADILTIPATRARNFFAKPFCPSVGICPVDPFGHTSLVTRIHLPPMTTHFYGPDPAPFFVNGSVNCEVPIQTFKYATDTGIDPKRPFVSQHPIEIDECQDTVCRPVGPCVRLPSGPAITQPLACRPKGANWIRGACTFGSGYYENRSAVILALEGPRPMFLGRCKEDPRVYGVQKGFAWNRFWLPDDYPETRDPSGAFLTGVDVRVRMNRVNTTYPFIPRKAIPGADDDNKFLDGLQEELDYLEDLRFDTCNCFPDTAPPTGGEFDLGPPGVSVAPPPADYPDLRSAPVLRAVFRDSALTTEGPDGGPIGGEVNGTNGTVKPIKAIKDQVHEKIRISHNMHGGFMTFAFMFAVPVGIFIVRYLKESFYGKTLLMYDVWYTLHIFSVMATFALLFWGMLMGIVAEVWREFAVGLQQFIGHETIGSVVLIIYAFLACTGGIRSYGSSSPRSLMMTIYVHAIVGYVFYYAGFVCMAVYCIELGGTVKYYLDQKDETSIRTVEGVIPILPLALIGAWIFIDLVFHVVMTMHVKRMDRQFPGLNRSVFPVMELLINDRDAPGKKFRLIMFAVYTVLSLIFSTAFTYSIIDSEFKVTEVNFRVDNINRRKVH